MMQKTNIKQKGHLDLDVERVTASGLAGKFIFPPFSILRGDGEGWLDRKRQWVGLGIKSELGRDVECQPGTFGGVLDEHGRDKYGRKPMTGTSVFDPVLCELMYAWFCPEGGQVVDPFAGGSVRGVVAAIMGRRYWGCELRKEQVEANIEQRNAIIPDCEMLQWVCGDAMHELRDAPVADFIFSCPPYGNLERYSELEGDLSNMEYSVFVESYRRIVKRAVHKLKHGGYACFVVANFRNRKTGYYHNLVGDTVRAFESCGARFYNDVVYVTPTGTLMLRVSRTFNASKKIGKAHQNVLVFYKE